MKVTNYNSGSGGITLEDKYSNRIESLNAIDRELIELNYSTGRVEKALELVRDVNEIGCDALLLKHVHSIELFEKNCHLQDKSSRRAIREDYEVICTFFAPCLHEIKVFM